MIEEEKNFPESCMNCAYFGNQIKIKKPSKNKEGDNTIKYGICYNENNKLEFIHSGEKSCCIMTPSNARCKYFKRREGR